MNDESAKLKASPSVTIKAGISGKIGLGDLGNYKDTLDLSAAEISELWDFLKKDTITLNQAFEAINVLGRQWHPQAERATCPTG